MVLELHLKLEHKFRIWLPFGAYADMERPEEDKTTEGGFAGSGVTGMV